MVKKDDCQINSNGTISGFGKTSLMFWQKDEVSP